MRKEIKLTNKEIAAGLPKGERGKPRTRGFVSAMRKAGYDGHTIRSAREWLTHHKSFTWASQYLPAAGRRLLRAGKTPPGLA